MKYSMMPIIKASSIEKFIQSQCDTEIDLNELFWEGKPHSLETIDFSDKSIKEAKKAAKYFDDDFTAHRLLVLLTLKDEFSDFPNEIIVNTEA